jgi:hypothetical protein
VRFQLRASSAVSVTKRERPSPQTKLGDLIELADAGEEVDFGKVAHQLRAVALGHAADHAEAGAVVFANTDPTANLIA